jgi:hypothetical protein
MLLKEVFLLIEGPWKKLPGKKGVLHRTITPAERANAEATQEKKKAEKRELADEKRRSAGKIDPSVDLRKIANKIEEVVGNTFPDGDPIDWLIKAYGTKFGEGMMMKYLDAAAKKYLDAKDYYDYLYKLWEQYGDDNPDFAHLSGKNNPWK